MSGKREMCEKNLNELFCKEEKIKPMSEMIMADNFPQLLKGIKHQGYKGGIHIK